MDHRRLLHVGFGAALALGSASAVAVDVSGAMTADNHYALYHGRDDGSGLAYIGRNEDGTAGNPGSWNFSLPENWGFEVAASDRLYVVAWDDGGPQMLLGNFTWAGSQLIVTNMASWEYFVPAGPAEVFSPGSAPPIAVDDLSSLIASASHSAGWSAPQAAADNDATNPTWGAIGGVHPDAQFMWHDALYGTSSSDGKYVVYRSVATLDPIPEPDTWAMLLAGLGLVLGTASWRRTDPQTAAISGK
jgi:hypothetical protein